MDKCAGNRLEVNTMNRVYEMHKLYTMYKVNTMYKIYTIYRVYSLDFDSNKKNVSGSLKNMPYTCAIKNIVLLNKKYKPIMNEVSFGPC